MCLCYFVWQNKKENRQTVYFDCNVIVKWLVLFWCRNCNKQCKMNNEEHISQGYEIMRELVLQVGPLPVSIPEKDQRIAECSERLTLLVRTMFANMERLYYYLHTWASFMQKARTPYEYAKWFMRTVLFAPIKFEIVDDCIHIFDSPDLAVHCSQLSPEESLLLLTVVKDWQYYFKVMGISSLHMTSPRYTECKLNVHLHTVVPRTIICARFLALALVQERGPSGAERVGPRFYHVYLQFRTAFYDLLLEKGVCMDVYTFELLRDLLHYGVHGLFDEWDHKKELLPPRRYPVFE